MFIFRIFFNLFFGIFGAATRLLWFPISLLMHNMFLVIIAIVVLVVYVEVKDSNVAQPHAPSVSTTAMPQAARDQQLAIQTDPNGKPIYIDPVMKRENGDSAFATDLYAAMTDEERAYYSQVFFYVMNKVPDGSKQPWQRNNISGDITPTRTFKNNDGTTCRIFSETLKVHTVQQTLNGIGCEKGGGSWCKLKRNATPACGLNGHRGLFDGLKSLF